MTQVLGEQRSAISDQLFTSLAEELKLPLQQIARQAEGGIISKLPLESLTNIQATADATLYLLDSYLLSLRLASDPEEKFATEPICVSAVLHDARSQLTRIAQRYDVDLELYIQNRYEPVLAHPQALKAAFVSLGYSLIEALPAMGTQQLRLQLAAHRTKYGIVAGMYCDVELTPRAFRRSQDLYGRARQPLVGVLPNAGAGIFVADSILRAMSSHLRVGRFQKLPGFAVTLAPSQQLAFI